MQLFRLCIYLLTMTFLSAVYVGYSTQGRVITLKNGKTRIIGIAKNEPDAAIAAFDEAEQHCSALKKSPIFEDEGILSLDQKKKKGFDMGKVARVMIEFRCA